MREVHRRVFVALALAGTAALAVSGIAIAASVSGTGTDSLNGVNQEVRAEVSKSKVVKKAQKGIPATPVALTVGVGINTDGGTRPPASREVDIGIGEKDEFIFDLTGLDKCTGSDLENASTEDAEQACKGALVGKGASEAECSAAPNLAGAKFDGIVRAFNGGKKGKNKILWLHAYTNFPTGPVATVLEGTLDKNNVLHVPVEILGEGSCGITDFFAKISSNVKVKGEKHSYVAAACPDKSWEFTGEFAYYDNPYAVSTLSPETTLKCKGTA